MPHTAKLAHLCADDAWVVQLLGLAYMCKAGHVENPHVVHVVQVHPAGRTESDVGVNHSMTFHHLEGLLQGPQDSVNAGTGGQCALTMTSLSNRNVAGQHKTSTAHKQTKLIFGSFMNPEAKQAGRGSAGVVQAACAPQVPQ